MWESEKRGLSPNSFEPNLFGCRPSALKIYLHPQNKLKWSIKPLLLSRTSIFIFISEHVTLHRMGGKFKKITTLQQSFSQAAIIHQSIKLSRINRLLRARRGAPATTCKLPCTDSNVRAAVKGPGPQGARLSLYFGLNCVALTLSIRQVTILLPLYQSQLIHFQIWSMLKLEREILLGNSRSTLRHSRSILGHSRSILRQSRSILWQVPQ